MKNDLASLENFLNDINELKKAAKLLSDIWVDIGPYGSNISDQTRWKLQDYFGFDDSE